MNMQMDSIDDHVHSLYAAARSHPARPPGVMLLAYKIFSESRLDLSPASLPLDAWLVFVDRAWQIRVHPHLRGARLNGAIARPLARWYCITRGVELPLNDFTNAILLPRPALEIAHGMLGYDEAQIASLLVVPRDIVAGRVARLFSPEESGFFRCVG